MVLIRALAGRCLLTTVCNARLKLDETLDDVNSSQKTEHENKFHA